MKQKRKKSWYEWRIFIDDRPISQSFCTRELAWEGANERRTANKQYGFYKFSQHIVTRKVKVEEV